MRPNERRCRNARSVSRAVGHRRLTDVRSLFLANLVATNARTRTLVRALFQPDRNLGLSSPQIWKGSFRFTRLLTHGPHPISWPRRRQSAAHYTRRRIWEKLSDLFQRPSASDSA